MSILPLPCLTTFHGLWIYLEKKLSNHICDKNEIDQWPSPLILCFEFFWKKSMFRYLAPAEKVNYNRHSKIIFVSTFSIHVSLSIQIFLINMNLKLIYAIFWSHNLTALPASTRCGQVVFYWHWLTTGPLVLSLPQNLGQSLTAD